MWGLTLWLWFATAFLWMATLTALLGGRPVSAALLAGAAVATTVLAVRRKISGRR